MIKHLLAVFLMAGLLTACSEDKTEQTESTSNEPVKLSYTPKYGAAQIGKQAADFSITSLTDGKVSLSDYKGKPVLINFWATWCPPCIAEIPEFVEVYEELKDKDFVVVGIAMDQKDLVEEFVKKYNVSYPIAYGQDDVSDVSIQYGNTMGALPYNIVLNRDHKVVYSEPGPLSRTLLETIVKPLL